MNHHNLNSTLSLLDWLDQSKFTEKSVVVANEVASLRKELDAINAEYNTRMSSLNARTMRLANNLSDLANLIEADRLEDSGYRSAMLQRYPHLYGSQVKGVKQKLDFKNMPWYSVLAVCQAQSILTQEVDMLALMDDASLKSSTNRLIEIRKKQKFIELDSHSISMDLLLTKGFLTLPLNCVTSIFSKFLTDVSSAKKIGKSLKIFKLESVVNRLKQSDLKLQSLIHLYDLTIAELKGELEITNDGN